jgi:hypothetical protein
MEGYELHLGDSRGNRLQRLASVSVAELGASQGENAFRVTDLAVRDKATFVVVAFNSDGEATVQGAVGIADVGVPLAAATAVRVSADTSLEHGLMTQSVDFEASEDEDLVVGYEVLLMDARGGLLHRVTGSRLWSRACGWAQGNGTWFARLGPAGRRGRTDFERWPRS